MVLVFGGLSRRLSSLDPQDALERKRSWLGNLQQEQFLVVFHGEVGRISQLLVLLLIFLPNVFFLYSHMPVGSEAVMDDNASEVRVRWVERAEG